MTQDEITKLVERVQRLENRVFPEQGGGDGLAVRLDELAEQLKTLEAKTTGDINKINIKISGMIKTIALLRKIVPQMQEKQAVKYFEVESFEEEGKDEATDH